MSLSSPAPSARLRNLGAIGLALAWTAVSFGAALSPAPALAQNPSKAYYRAELVQPATQSRAIAGDLVWACKGTSCIADKSSSRPLRVCRQFNRKFGTVANFTAKGELLPAEDLAKCNG